MSDTTKWMASFDFLSQISQALLAVRGPTNNTSMSSKYRHIDHASHARQLFRAERWRRRTSGEWTKGHACGTKYLTSTHSGIRKSEISKNNK